MDLMIDNLRLKALQRMLKAYRPGTVPLSFVCEELAFDEVEVGREFLVRLGCSIVEKTASEGTAEEVATKKEWLWNTKDSSIDPQAIYTEEKLLL